MIQVLVGDLFNSSAQTLVNTVNCVGIMGKGVALEFKKRFPDMFDDYAYKCSIGEVRLGRPYLYRTLFQPWILNFPTKQHWRSVSRLADIIAGLEHLERRYHDWGITSLAVPPLGCGQGQLDWRVVGPTLYRYLSRLDIPVELYAPIGTPQAEMAEDFLTGKLNDVESHSAHEDVRIEPAWIALVEILARIEREPYHWPIGRIGFQKIAYFATEAGLPTKLTFDRGSYGPFSDGLKPLITKLVNNSLLEETSSGRMFVVHPGATYRDALHHGLYRSALAQWDPVIDSIVDLFLRMRTSQAEIAATVHYAWSSILQGYQQSVSEKDVLDAVMQWKAKRNPPLKDVDVAQSIRGLNVLGWIRAQPSYELPTANDPDLYL